MSAEQLATVIREIEQCFGAWDADTSLQKMRKDWDDLSGDFVSGVGATVLPVNANGVPGEWISAPKVPTDRAILYLHGGGYVFGSPRSHRCLAETLSREAKAQVLLLDYRLAPEHPFPAAVEDAVKAYQWLLDKGISPKKLVISGDSAGGGLTLATLVALRDRKIPLPACAIPLSPWADMEATGGTIDSLDSIDPIVHKPMLLNLGAMYVGTASPRDPLASPIHADLRGLPPLLIQVGARETLLDDSKRIAENARKAGVKVELDICKDMIHVFQLFCSRVDESADAVKRMGQFALQHTS